MNIELEAAWKEVVMAQCTRICTGGNEVKQQSNSRHHSRAVDRDMNSIPFVPNSNVLFHMFSSSRKHAEILKTLLCASRQVYFYR